MFYHSDDPVVLEQELGRAQHFKYLIESDKESYEPVMDIYYPIIDDISDAELLGRDDYNAKDHKIVGVIAATVYWRNVFRNALPQGSNGITIVVGNSKTESFTYQINGPDRSEERR